MNEVPTTTVTGPAKGKRLTNLVKNQIVYELILNYKNNKLEKGLINQIARKYEVTRLVISKIWKASLLAIKAYEQPDVERKYKGSSKRFEFDSEKVSSIPLHLRTNIRTLVK